MRALKYRQQSKLQLALASVVLLIPFLLLSGCGGAEPSNPWEDAPLWDPYLREMNARPSDSDQTDAALLAAARGHFASLESSEAVELLDTSDPQDLRVESAVSGDIGATEGGYGFSVYIVVSQKRAGTREWQLVRMGGHRPAGGGPATLDRAEREDKRWARELKGLSRSEVTEILGEDAGAHDKDDMVFEFLRGDELRPQWLIASFESGRVSAVRMDLNRQ